MTFFALLILALLPLSFPAAVAAPPDDANVAGEWEIKWGTKESMNTERLVLEQKGANLTGKLYSDTNTYAPITGKVSGANVEFGVPKEQARMSFVPWFIGTATRTSMEGKVTVGPIKDRFTFTAKRK